MTGTKTIQVIHLITSLPRGGRERQLANLLKGSGNSKVVSKAILFNAVEDSYIDEFKLTEQVIYINSKGFLKRIREIIHILTEQQANIIWSWGSIEALYGICAAFFGKWKHINGTIRHGIVLFRFDQLVRLFLLHLSRNIVANSLSGLKANGIRRGYVMYNGIDNDFFTHINAEQKRKIKEEQALSENAIIFISVANLLPYKDYFTVLKCLSELKKNGTPFYYLIIGQGPMKKQIEEYITQLELLSEVRLLGKTREVKKYLSISDIFIHSSRGEGCSNAILEAMANRLPIIASNTGGTPEIVKKEIGLLFEFKNQSDLYIKINVLVNDMKLRQSMADSGYQFALKNFSVNTMITKYNQLVESIQA